LLDCRDAFNNPRDAPGVGHSLGKAYKNPEPRDYTPEPRDNSNHARPALAFFALYVFIHVSAPFYWLFNSCAICSHARLPLAKYQTHDFVSNTAHRPRYFSTIYIFMLLF
jgi:hypothetical protein